MACHLSPSSSTVGCLYGVSDVFSIAFAYFTDQFTMGIYYIKAIASIRSHLFATDIALNSQVSPLVEQFAHFQDDPLGGNAATLKILGWDGDDTPRRLKLTESMLAHDIEDIIQKMHALRAIGVGTSLDDFGTGYSSLTYLKRLPLDQLKIDQSFVRDVMTNDNDASIAKTIINLGKDLHFTVIAEGVETPDQRDFLIANDCHRFQGFLYSKPVSAQQLAQFVNPAHGLGALSALQRSQL